MRLSSRRLAQLALFGAALLAACGPDYDVVIENGRVVDGTGSSWMYGDVAIKGDRIAAVSPKGALRE
jgi:adenine deaminase